MPQSGVKQAQIAQLTLPGYISRSADTRSCRNKSRAYAPAADPMNNLADALALSADVR